MLGVIKMDYLSNGGVSMKNFLTETLGSRENMTSPFSVCEEEFSDISDEEKDLETEVLKSTRDNFILWRDFQEES